MSSSFLSQQWSESLSFQVYDADIVTQHDGIIEWSVWEVIMFRWGHEGRNAVNEFRKNWKSSLSLIKINEK